MTETSPIYDIFRQWLRWPQVIASVGFAVLDLPTRQGHY
jgi:hypothetical protein